MKTLLTLSCVVALLGVATATAGDSKVQQAATATCHVCRYNRDLACVEFRVKPNTPETVYRGTRYCFCSGECQKAFVRKPEKYIPKRK